MNTTLYKGFEQVGNLPQNFFKTGRTNDYYPWRYYVVFFKSNNWRHTKLGHLNLPVDELTKGLNRNTVLIEISGI